MLSHLSDKRNMYRFYNFDDIGGLAVSKLDEEAPGLFPGSTNIILVPGLGVLGVISVLWYSCVRDFLDQVNWSSGLGTQSETFISKALSANFLSFFR